MKTTLHATIIALAIGLMTAPAVSHAQLGSQLAVPNSPAYEWAANRLRSAPPRQYDFSKAILSDIMRLMANDAGISFFGLPEGATGADRIVTFTINASPFKALETLSKANGISLIFENDIWYLRPADDSELVGRIYEINYNSQELVRKNDQGGGSLGGQSGGGGQSGSSNIGLNLQGSPDFFVTEPSRLLEDIRGILDLQTSGVSATFAPTTSVDNVNRFNVSGLQGQPNVVVRTQGGEGSPTGDDPSSQAKVIWNSDANTLYVVATRQQHQWIEGYIAAADQPQPLIAVEVKFLEINKDPRRDLGIDWTGILSSNPSGGFGAEIFNGEENGTGVIDTAIDLANIGSGYTLPTAILSYDDLQLRLNALFRDQRNRTVSYPRMVTLDNREVSFRSVVNQPVLGSSASASLGAGATTTSSVEYVPIGTVINILPKRMANDNLLLNVSVTVSDIIGTEVINGNPFPIATSRVYTAPITVQSGYTVAISGLDKATTSDTRDGVPVLGRIPIIGYAFKKKSKSRSNQHLMMLITPVILNSGDAGIGKTPITRNPWENTPLTEEDVEEMKHIRDLTGADSEPNGPRTNADLEQGETYFDTAPLAVARPIATPIEDNGAIMMAATNQPAPPKERKKLRIFGRKNDQQTEPAALPTKKAEMTEISPGSVANTGEVIKPDTPARLDMPILPASDPAINAAGPPAPVTKPAFAANSTPVAKPIVAAKADAPKKAPAEAYGPKATSIDSTATQQIITGAEKIEAGLSKVPGGDSRLSPDDGQLVRNSYDESKRLLSEIEKLRQSKEVPMKGEISDAWWKLVASKGKALKLSQRSPQSLAINISEEEEE